MPDAETRRAGIRLALILTFFNFVGNSAARVVLTLYALELQAPAYTAGMIGGLLFLFPLLLSWPVGARADRHGAKGLLLAGAGCGVVSFLLPYCQLQRRG
jgi:MFS family permease